MTGKTQATGKWGEEIAARYLERQGYSIPGAELSTRARRDRHRCRNKEDTLVFVEVKTRSSHSFAYPEDAVNRRKQASLLSAAEDYLQAIRKALKAGNLT